MASEFPTHRITKQRRNRPRSGVAPIFEYMSVTMIYSMYGRESSALRVVLCLIICRAVVVEPKAAGNRFLSLTGAHSNGTENYLVSFKSCRPQAFARPPVSDSRLSQHSGSRIGSVVKPNLVVGGAGIKTVRATHTVSLPPQNVGASGSGKESCNETVPITTMAPMKVVTKPPSSNGGVTDEKPNNAVDSTNYVLKNLTMLSVWYAGTVMYNIENKKALNMCPLPKTIATMQMLLGMPYFLSRWMAGLKAMPTIHVSEEGIQRESPKGGIVERIKHKVKNGLCRVGNAVQAYSSMLRQSVLIAMIHMLSVTALGAGGISFVHIVKSSEPLFVSALALFTGMESMSPVTYATLVPILTGVALASVKDVNFSRLALVTSLASNVCATVRRIEVKKFFDQDLDKIGRNLDVMNVSSLVTIFSSLMLAPIALMEAPQWASAYRSVVYKFGHAGLMKLVRHIALSGFFYTLTNEVSFFALSQLTPVSHAVANTLKRVFLIFGSSMFFQTKITRLGHLGSAMAIVGAMLYSLSKHYGG